MTSEAFAAALPPARLADGLVQVWVADLDRWVGSPAGRIMGLAPEETRRAERFRDPLHGQRWSAGRAFLRTALASHLKSDPGKLSFEVAEMGKPWLVGSALSFNLSHSGDRVVVAVTSGRDVGVDVEAIVDKGSELDQIAERFFTPIERADFRASSGSERVAAFYRCWTRKEAIMKADGAGLAVSPELINVGAGADPAPIVVDPPWQHLERYRVFDLDVTGPYATALAVADVVEVEIAMM